MKKICRTIKLMKFKNKLNEESIKNLEGTEFLVCFEDNKYEHVYFKYDLVRLLEKEHIRTIRYIFDMTDRIMIRRDILIDTEEI